MTHRNTCVKMDFFSNLNAFLFNLTDFTYKMLGLTVMYVPVLSKELTAEKGSIDKDLVKLLESVVSHWTTQIKLTLIDEEETDMQELLSINDEYDFWTYRCE